MMSRNLADVAVRVQETAGLTISTTMHDAGAELFPHQHRRPYFCFVAAGRFVEQSGALGHDCGAGTLLFHPAGEVHGDRFVAATRCLNVELPATWELDRGELGAAFERRGQRRELGLTALARRLQGELEHGDAASELAIQGLVLELAAEWSRAELAPARHQAWLAEAVAILRAEFRAGVEFRDIARRVGVHPVRLSREFRRAQRMTMTEFVLRLRVEQASQLLASTSWPLARIALESGFADQSHLAKVFRRYTGTTCTRFRAPRRSAARAAVR
ncbi:MAG TPA: AraC family transcriptional regulator [Kofleriaceae bacterium]|nr:AraC family transcriptional regulator [Kofleriaceae bacterium]